MRHASRIALVAIGALLAAVDLQAQKPSQLIVETGRPTPTVVKTDDRIKVTYKVRWLDLVQKGENAEIHIYDKDMEPENLPVSPFEAIALEMGPLRKDRDEFYKDYTYTFRVINKDKSSAELKHVIPGFRFYWSIKKAGEEDKDSELKEFVTDPIPIKYVSTIHTDEDLFVRDEAILSDYSTKSWVYRVMPLVLVFVSGGWFFVGLAAPKIQVLMRKEKLPGGDKANLSTRKDFYKLLDKLESGQQPYLDFEQKPKRELIANDLFVACRDMILSEVEVPMVKRSFTAKDLQNYISENLAPGEGKDALATIANRMIVYSKLIDGINISDIATRDAVIGEAKRLRGCADKLVWHRKLVKKIWKH